MAAVPGHEGVSAKNSKNGKKAPCILGLDIGTTSVKACLLHAETFQLLASDYKDTQARVADPGHIRGSDLQDASRIYQALTTCLRTLPRDHMRHVRHVAVCGQMHGIIFWKQGQAWTKNERGSVDFKQCSPLYTWQDQRCDGPFLSSLRPPSSHLRLSSGYGCVTAIWLARNNPAYLAQFDRAGTIMDFLTAILCNLDSASCGVAMSAQNAASWGYFDTASRQWNRVLLQEQGFPEAMLPEVVKLGAEVGRLERTMYELPADTPVYVAMGDLQCSVRSTLRDIEKNAVLNISTSAQISYIMAPGTLHPGRLKPPTSDASCSSSEIDDADVEEQSLEYLPYTDQRYLVTAASLNGGNVLASFVRMVQQWLKDFGCNTTQEQIWGKIGALSASQWKDGEGGGEDQSLLIRPTLFGERHQPDLRASASNLSADNIDLGSVVNGIFKGIAKNLSDMMPRRRLEKAGISCIMGSGSCLTRNQSLKKSVEQVYGMDVEFSPEGNACIGAALFVADKLDPQKGREFVQKT